MANYKDNPNKNFKIRNGSLRLRMHVFEPDESVNKEDWYKDMSAPVCRCRTCASGGCCGWEIPGQVVSSR